MQSHYDRQIIIGESTASNLGTRATFEEYGFLPLEREYNVRLVELDRDDTTYEWILDHNLYPNPIRVLNTFLNPNNYIFSVTRLKTHGAVVATLSLKNVVMGSPIKLPSHNINDKVKMHANTGKNHSPKMLHFNLFKLAHKVHPDFSVLDGIEGMEGNGPGNGTPVDHKVVLAGPDFIAVDRVGTELMGIAWEDVGYLQYCAAGGLGQGDRSKIKIIGPEPEPYIISYRLHDNIEWQYEWKDEVTLEKLHETYW